MKIYSKFKDSYDHNSAFGIDPGIVYNRTEIELALYHEPTLDPKLVATLKLLVEPINEICHHANRHTSHRNPIHLSWLFVNNKIHLYYEGDGETIEYTPDEYIAKLKGDWTQFYVGSRLDELIHTANIKQFNTLLDCPLVLIYNKQVILNPNLLAYGIVPKFNVFQEVQTFLSNKVKPISGLSDVVKRDKAGFDIKSFKHRKGG